jgi:hypothetical protein
MAPSLHESQLAIERLLESLIESLLESRLESLIERAELWEEYSFAQAAFGLWQTLSLWKLWLIEASKSVEALAT